MRLFFLILVCLNSLFLWQVPAAAQSTAQEVGKYTEALLSYTDSLRRGLKFQEVEDTLGTALEYLENLN